MFPVFACSLYSRLRTPYTAAVTKRFTSIWHHFFDVLLNLVIIVAVVVGIRTFIVSPFQVEGHSMQNTLENREYIIINKFAYFIGTPKRGDVVVFRPPNVDHNKYYVKRVIGLPGDTIIIRNGSVFLLPSGKLPEQKLDEPYLNDNNKSHTFVGVEGGVAERRYDVPEGHYFVLGDNRLGSLDSRSFRDTHNTFTPYVPENDIKGKVWFVLLPLNNIHTLVQPDYGVNVAGS